MRLLPIAIALAACQPPAPAAPATPPAPDCAAVIATTARFVADQPAERREQLKATAALRCVEDHWSAAATSCIGAARDPEAAHACMRDRLTVAQHERLMQGLGPAAGAAPAPGPTSQVELAARTDAEGTSLFATGRFADASAKFRDAVARIPEPQYFQHLCQSLDKEGKFGEALTACNAGLDVASVPAMRAALTTEMDTIKHEAQQQGLELRH